MGYPSICIAPNGMYCDEYNSVIGCYSGATFWEMNYYEGDCYWSEGETICDNFSSHGLAAFDQVVRAFRAANGI